MTFDQKHPEPMIRNEALVWDALNEIQDPEIPVLSLVDLRIIRSVRVEGNGVLVHMTPTFLGCPALEYMKDEIRTKLLGLGFERVAVELQYSPSWSTDMLEDEAREKLRAFGVAPPEQRLALGAAHSRPVACPYCGSQDTRLDSPFGPTLCRQIFYCDGCKQSFERFKTI
jgi:ring-1,2-phenylacetyl-CoA epoxidase subunit PaaD